MKKLLLTLFLFPMIGFSFSIDNYKELKKASDLLYISTGDFFELYTFLQKGYFPVDNYANLSSAIYLLENTILSSEEKKEIFSQLTSANIITNDEEKDTSIKDSYEESENEVKDKKNKKRSKKKSKKIKKNKNEAENIENEDIKNNETTTSMDNIEDILSHTEQESQVVNQEEIIIPQNRRDYLFFLFIAYYNKLDLKLSVEENKNKLQQLNEIWKSFKQSNERLSDIDWNSLETEYQRQTFDPIYLIE